ncbi:MAG: nucleoside triphosphate pyrophosphohydrolase [Chloroflexi bacterium]|nr:nucleoside triphosphate pyrophosphohydrolase [Chloroflexota bacterium]
MTVHVVGLGPGSASLLTLAADELLTSGLPVLLRTRHHPTVAELDSTGAFADCDDLYQAGGSFDAIYAEVVRRVLSMAAKGDMIYAVPGHPLVAERTVAALVAAAEPAGVPVVIHPGLSYADVAAAALCIDFGAVQLCDALELRLDAQRPALISQVHDADSASALKLQLLDIYPAGHPATILRALGTPEAGQRTVPLAELDHQPAGYLDCIYLPPLPAVEDVRRFDGLDAVIRRLHAEDGCPWDREQTHESLRSHLLEESYEVLEAIDAGEPAALAEELGDVLLQVLMHAAVAERRDEFTLADVIEHIARKLIRRHPHVFGDAAAATAEDVYRSWETLKQQEKPRASILEGVPVTLPALAASQSIQGRARRIGFDWPDIEGPLAKLAEEVQEFSRAEGAAERADEFGDILFVLANIAQRLDIDAEQALRLANAKFRRRFGRVERLAAENGTDLKDLDLDGLDRLWDQAKAQERAEGRL